MATSMEVWGQHYEVSGDGFTIRKDGKQVPVQNFRHLPAEVLAAARANKAGYTAAKKTGTSTAPAQAAGSPVLVMIPGGGSVTDNSQSVDPDEDHEVSQGQGNGEEPAFYDNRDKDVAQGFLNLPVTDVNWAKVLPYVLGAVIILILRRPAIRVMK